EKFNFFGLEIEAWKIDNSPVAPKFNVISKPNGWTKTVAETAKSFEAGTITEVKQLQREYWEDLGEMVERQSKVLKAQKAQPQHWANFAIGNSTAHLAALLNSKQKRIGVQLLLKPPNAKALFDSLTTQKQDIEQELGHELVWDRLPNAKESHVEFFL